MKLTIYIGNNAKVILNNEEGKYNNPYNIDSSKKVNNNLNSDLTITKPIRLSLCSLILIAINSLSILKNLKPLNTALTHKS